jgi:protein-tyrosine-phosphatase
MTTPTVLFLCPHNALRSVIAAALLNRLADGRVRRRRARGQAGSSTTHETGTRKRYVSLYAF